jgi:adenine/guanine phosphoribosyltransferase-like PRPP-binding protein
MLLALAEKLSAYDPEVVVGLPTLGLTLASAVAIKLGHARYVPLSNSVKFWYRPELSVPLSSWKERLSGWNVVFVLRSPKLTVNSHPLG